MTKIQGSEYINSQRKDYSLYVLQNRAIPHMADGLKASARRVMWIARDGKKWKSANLAGACMPLHPHAAPEDAVNTLAAHYGNNNALLDGIGSFGTRLEPTEYGASRYTSVKASDFAKDAFYTDIEIIPMKLNYDNTLEEPVHFLPLVPVAFLNPTSGIAIGFACDIFSRSLKDIIDCQIKILQGTIPKKEPFVQFIPLKCTAVEKTEDDRWVFKGEFKRINTTTIEITNFPFGTNHEKLTNHLISLVNDGKMQDFDDNSKDVISITCKFRRDQLLKLENDEKMLNFLGIFKKAKENINLINFDSKTVISPTFFEAVSQFTNWRLGWYIKRYERLRDLLLLQIQKYNDIILAINNDAGGQSRKCKSKEELKTWLQGIGVVNLDYISGLPIYRLTKEEKQITEEKIKEAKIVLKQYEDIISNPEKQKEKYIEELRSLTKKYS